jgi:hypothetical protein
VTFDGTGVIGGFYKPADGSPFPNITFYLIHAQQDYVGFWPCHPLPQRGFSILCLNNRASKMEPWNDLHFEDMMADVPTGMEWLRNRTDVGNIIIFGHSDGGAMMAAYQNIAENGAQACNGSEKIYPCSNAIDRLPTADGALLADCNYGISTSVVLSQNPGVVNNRGTDINEDLSLFKPDNGFVNGSQSNYTQAFSHKFTAGVVSRRRASRIRQRGNTSILLLAMLLSSTTPSFISRTAATWATTTRFSRRTRGT